MPWLQERVQGAGNGCGPGVNNSIGAVHGADTRFGEGRQQMACWQLALGDVTVLASPLCRLKP